MYTIIAGTNEKVVKFYSAYFDMLGQKNEGFLSISDGVNIGRTDPDIVNIVVILDSKEDYHAYSRLRISVDEHKKNMIVICMNEQIYNQVSSPKVITFKHKDITFDFADTLAKMSICEPYMKEIKKGRTPEKILEHVKHTLVKGNISLPMKNECGMHLLSALEKEDISYKEIDNMSKLDPALHTGIIRMANSVYFSGAGSTGIKTVEKALVRVGINNAKAFLINFITKSLAANKDMIFSKELNESIDKSVKRASLCFVLSNLFSIQLNSTMFTIGLLSALGEIFMYAAISDYLYGEVVNGEEQNEYKSMAENNGMIVGSMLLRKWKFSEEVYLPIMNCHKLAENSFINESKILNLAINMDVFYETGEMDPSLTKALKATGLKMSVTQLNNVRDEAVAHHKKIAEVLG